MRTAFLGLGTMGAAMARNVLRKGFPLTVWNRTAARASQLHAAGAAVASSPAEAARHAQLVISMLSDVPAVLQVLTGEHGVVQALSPGAIVVDMSTVDPPTARTVGAAVERAGGHFFDAPVSGSRKPAEDGTLLIMAAGEPSVIERARPVLEAMGRLVVVGAVGQGMAMKLVLNSLGAHLMAGLSAALVMGAKAGLRPRDMLEVIQGGAFSSPLFAAKGQRILQGNFEPDFSLSLLRKDQRLVAENAAAAGVPMPIHQAILAVLDDAVQAGLGEQDLCALIRWFERPAGIEVRDKT